VERHAWPFLHPHHLDREPRGSRHVLPMGARSERPRLMSQEPHAGALYRVPRQPVAPSASALEKPGQRDTFSPSTVGRPHEGGRPRPGWEGGTSSDSGSSCGVVAANRSGRPATRHPQGTSSRPTTAGPGKLPASEGVFFLRWIFEHTCPGPAHAAEAGGARPAQPYMRQYVAFLIARERVRHARELSTAGGLAGGRRGRIPAFRTWSQKTGASVGRGGVRAVVWAAFSRPPRAKLEFFSKTLKDWGGGRKVAGGTGRCRTLRAEQRGPTGPEIDRNQV